MIATPFVDAASMRWCWKDAGGVAPRSGAEVGQANPILRGTGADSSKGSPNQAPVVSVVEKRTGADLKNMVASPQEGRNVKSSLTLDKATDRKGTGASNSILVVGGTRRASESGGCRSRDQLTSSTHLQGNDSSSSAVAAASAVSAKRGSAGRECLSDSSVGPVENQDSGASYHRWPRHRRIQQSPRAPPPPRHPCLAASAAGVDGSSSLSSDNGGGVARRMSVRFLSSPVGGTSGRQRRGSSGAGIDIMASPFSTDALTPSGAPVLEVPVLHLPPDQLTAERDGEFMSFVPLSHHLSVFGESDDGGTGAGNILAAPKSPTSIMLKSTTLNSILSGQGMSSPSWTAMHAGAVRRGSRRRFTDAVGSDGSKSTVSTPRFIEGGPDGVDAESSDDDKFILQRVQSTVRRHGNRSRLGQTANSASSPVVHVAVTASTPLVAQVTCVFESNERMAPMNLATEAASLAAAEETGSPLGAPSSDTTRASP